MTRQIPPVRYIKHDSIRIGDVIKVEQQVEDATIERKGQVAKRERSTYGTDYLTAAGIVLYTYTRDDLTQARITLLRRTHNITEMENTLW